MPTDYKCPGCGNTVSIPNAVSQMLDGLSGEEMGCLNEDQHEDDKPLVMWKED